MALLSILSTLLRSVQSFLPANISEVHRYPPQHLNPTSSSTQHTIAETSASGPLCCRLRSRPEASTNTAIALLHRLAHKSETAMNRADIESAEKQDIRRRYVGKQAPRASRRKLAAAVVMGGKGLVGLESEKERLEVEKVARNAMKRIKSKAKAKELTKRKAHTPGTPPEFCLPPIGV